MNKTKNQGELLTNRVIEQSLIGSCLLDPNAIWSTGNVPYNAFADLRHKTIWKAMLELASSGTPVDFLLLTSHLESKNELEKVGGAAYITSLIGMIPTAVHANHYANIVKDLYTRRELQRVGAKIVTIANDQEVAYPVSASMGEIIQMAKNSGGQMSQTSDQAWRDYIEFAGDLKGTPSGFRDLDKIIYGLRSGEMIVIGARPSIGKTAILLNIAQNVSRHGTVLFASVEMTIAAIQNRIISQDTGLTTEQIMEECNREARDMAIANHATDKIIYLGQSGLTTAQLMLEAQRIKLAYPDLRAIFVDYLQLMGDEHDNPVTRVTRISKNLKEIAMSLDVPIIVASQLNRMSESRSDKKPQMSDLRECLTGDTLILRRDTGERVPISQLVGKGNIPVWSLDNHWKLIGTTMSDVWESGIKPIFKLTTRSGKFIRASANHPFRQVSGWTRLEHLAIGDFIATPRFVPEQINYSQLPDENIVLLAHLIGDGCFVKSQPLHYAKQDPDCLDVVEWAARIFDVTPRRVVRPTYTSIYLSANQHLTHGKRNPIVKWLDEIGLYGLRSHEKFVPAIIFGLPHDKIALFLQHLWATDGSVRWNQKRNKANVHYSTSSFVLACDVSHLLLRLGIASRLRIVQQRNGYKPSYVVNIFGKDDQLRFLDVVGTFGKKSDHVVAILAGLKNVRANPNCDLVPDAPAHGRHGMSRERARRIALTCNMAGLEELANSDVYWDQIASIELDGEEMTYDATVPTEHNFIANDFIVHNSGSIEHDSDIVILMYRDMEDNSVLSTPHKVVDLIVAKHRNGPTGSLQLIFHKDRFAYHSIERRVQ